MFYLLKDFHFFLATCQNTVCGAGAVCTVSGGIEACSCSTGKTGDPNKRCCGKKKILD